MKLFQLASQSGCQNIKLAGNMLPPFPSFWSPGDGQTDKRKSLCLILDTRGGHFNDDVRGGHIDEKPKVVFPNPWEPGPGNGQVQGNRDLTPEWGHGRSAT